MCSYWSHDGFTEQADGLMIPEDSKYADQQKVFEDLGRLVLSNSFEGPNMDMLRTDRPLSAPYDAADPLLCPSPLLHPLRSFS